MNITKVIELVVLISLLYLHSLKASLHNTYATCSETISHTAETITALIIERLKNNKPFEIETKLKHSRSYCCCSTNNSKGYLIIHPYQYPLPKNFDQYSTTSLSDYYDPAYKKPIIFKGFLNQKQIAQIVAIKYPPQLLLKAQKSTEEIDSYFHQRNMTLQQNDKNLVTLKAYFCFLAIQNSNYANDQFTVSADLLQSILSGECTANIFYGPLLGKSFIPPNRRYKYVGKDYLKSLPPEWPKSEKEEEAQWLKKR